MMLISCFYNQVYQWALFYLIYSVGTILQVQMFAASALLYSALSSWSISGFANVRHWLLVAKA